MKLQTVLTVISVQVILFVGLEYQLTYSQQQEQEGRNNTLSTILGEGNKTLQIPTFTVNQTDAAEPKNTETIPINGQQVIEFDWRLPNEPYTAMNAPVDVNEYVNCVSSFKRAMMEEGERLGVDLAVVEGKVVVNLLPDFMDYCIWTNSANFERALGIE